MVVVLVLICYSALSPSECCNWDKISVTSMYVQGLITYFVRTIHWIKKCDLSCHITNIIEYIQSIVWFNKVIYSMDFFYSTPAAWVQILPLHFALAPSLSSTLLVCDWKRVQAVRMKWVRVCKIFGRVACTWKICYVHVRYDYGIRRSHWERAEGKKHQIY